MNKEIFGSTKKYKMLDYLTEKIRELGRNKKVYLITFINEFNQLINNVDKNITNVELKNYTLELVHRDYKQQTDKLFEKYDKKIVTYLKGYINGRIKNSKI